MCGIVGILARGSEVPKELLERATQSLAHRGRVIGQAVEVAPKTTGAESLVDTQIEAQAG